MFEEKRGGEPSIRNSKGGGETFHLGLCDSLKSQKRNHHRTGRLRKSNLEAVEGQVAGLIDTWGPREGKKTSSLRY